MNHEQRAAHLVLQGWEAWLEDSLFNITHPQRGTVWCSSNDPERPMCDRQHMYMLPTSKPVAMTDIPPDILSAMEAKIPWLELEGMWDE